MAREKLPYSSLGKTARYYRDNPQATEKKDATSTKINRRPEQRKKRSRNIYGKGGKDVSHTKDGLKMKPIKSNRGSKTDTHGDVRARGGKTKKKK